MNRRGWPASSAPCSLSGSTTSPTCAGRFALHALPSASVIRIAGLVMLGSVPPSVGGGVPAPLSALTLAVAPAACAFRALKTGRASCRERVCHEVYISLLAVSLNQKTLNNTTTT